MELHEQTVETQRSLTLPWQETLLMPVGDIQYGSEACDLDKFRRHIEWGMKHKAYFIGMGDYLDVASPSGRQKIKSADFYDSVHDAMEDKVREHLDTFTKVLKGTEGRWLGLVHGHHYYEFLDGTTTDTLLAKSLKANYLGTCGIIQIGFKRTKTSRISAQIWVHHGQGSGATMASPMNKLERMMSRFPTVDIFLIGHYSRKVAYPVDVLIPHFGLNRLFAKRRILACTGGFMKGYQVGTGVKRLGRPHGGYIETGMMPPTNLGGLVIRMRPVHSNDEDRLDLSVEQ